MTLNAIPLTEYGRQKMIKASSTTYGCDYPACEEEITLSGMEGRVNQAEGWVFGRGPVDLCPMHMHLSVQEFQFLKSRADAVEEGIV